MRVFISIQRLYFGYCPCMLQCYCYTQEFYRCLCIYHFPSACRISSIFSLHCTCAAGDSFSFICLKSLCSTLILHGFFSVNTELSQQILFFLQHLKCIHFFLTFIICDEKLFIIYIVFYMKFCFSSGCF